MKAIFFVCALVGAAALWASQVFMLMVVPPIGAIPEGVTVLMWRTGQLQMIESPDAMCERTQQRVTLLCRGVAIGALKEENIIYRLPYSRDLYLWSTGGKDFSVQTEFPGLLGPIPSRP